MTPYCNYCRQPRDGSSVKGPVFGRDIRIKPCANGTELKAMVVCQNPAEDPAIVIFDRTNTAAGYADIHFCPMCGRKLMERE